MNDQLEYQTFEINLTERFGEISPKVEKNPINYFLINIYGEKFVIEALESL